MERGRGRQTGKLHNQEGAWEEEELIRVTEEQVE